MATSYQAHIIRLWWFKTTNSIEYHSTVREGCIAPGSLCISRSIAKEEWSKWPRMIRVPQLCLGELPIGQCSVFLARPADTCYLAHHMELISKSVPEQPWQKLHLQNARIRVTKNIMRVPHFHKESLLEEWQWPLSCFLPKCVGIWGHQKTAIQEIIIKWRTTFKAVCFDSYEGEK